MSVPTIDQMLDFLTEQGWTTCDPRLVEASVFSEPALRLQYQRLCEYLGETDGMSPAPWCVHGLLPDEECSLCVDWNRRRPVTSAPHNGAIVPKQRFVIVTWPDEDRGPELYGPFPSLKAQSGWVDACIARIDHPLMASAHFLMLPADEPFDPALLSNEEV